MVKHKSKYQREYDIRQDKQQCKLDPLSKTGIKFKPQDIIEVTVAHKSIYLCPFCLHRGKIEEYLISTKKGYHKGLGKCPECNNKMQLKTLTSNMTPEQFAEYAHGYRTSGYWSKVPFSKFNERLKEINWAIRFWGKYRQLKGESTDESYDDYIQRKQYEQAKEEGWIEE